MPASENKFKNVFLKKGFFIKRSFFDKTLINKIFKEVHLAKGVIKYYDKKKKY